ncbi:hypothetical protein BGW38_002795 [Lunasporangiospora selenospora]|uniref:BHLH domain-containing protein n=1 Tax=Lunasporangiospora selenospora TaxID=979761 RepID=A0A9P6FSA2_9FUNG|nr:hypothetical protein BGW38_002795 [Lunasporangiospora selenospora]
MAFPSMLSDHEQRAFSDFVSQLAHEDSDAPIRRSGPPPTPPQPMQQHQHILLPPLQHPNTFSPPQNGLLSPPLSASSPGSGGVLASASTTLPTDSKFVFAQQQQRDWIQQISTNPLLAPGGVIDPHTMSQAFLQNPELMAQASAISQAMVLAQQEQMRQNIQQQQQHDQQQSSFALQPPFPPTSYSQPRPFGSHSSSQEHSQSRPYFDRDSSSPTNEVVVPSQATPTMSMGKRKSNGSMQIESSHHGSDSMTTPPLLPSSTSDYSYRSGRNWFESEPPAMKPVRRKESSATSASGDSPYRSSRDMYDDSAMADQDYSEESRHNERDESPSKKQILSTDSSDPTAGSGSPVRSAPQAVKAQSRPRKAPHELLTEAEKKANHIASEQKRRQNIRIGFDSLVEIVPTLSECHRSEALILQKYRAVA